MNEILILLGADQLRQTMAKDGKRFFAIRQGAAMQRTTLASRTSTNVRTEFASLHSREPS